LLVDADYILLDIAAFPESVNIIEGIDNDIRTPDKLIDGINDTRDGRHAWLAPIIPGQVSKSEPYNIIINYFLLNISDVFLRQIVCI